MVSILKLQFVTYEIIWNNFISTRHDTGYIHRVDSVIESTLREIIGSKNFALINLSLNFCKTTIYDNKVFLENLIAVD